MYQYNNNAWHLVSLDTSDATATENDIALWKKAYVNGKEITGEEIGLRYNTQEQLVQHLIDVTNNSIGYYTPMILRAQQVVSQLYSTETHVKNVYNLYNRIQNNVN